MTGLDANRQLGHGLARRREASTMKMLRAIPALPVRDVTRSSVFYRDQLGFTLLHKEDGFAIVQRDTVELHLWAASDEDWRTREGASPVVSGAESFIAGTASCRVGVEGVDALHEQLHPLDILHPKGQLSDTAWGTREFAVIDPDNNLISFYERK
jgi:catechol 2,3-dioxygenase-like lactoylglutathione lyase family enzyme